MSDIFISYSRLNQKWVKNLASALEKSGYDVWWDTGLLAGDDFHHVIPEELEKAKCVLVVWSNASITRKWVKAEASNGDERGVLVPICMERAITPPMPFNMLQTEDMSSWNDSSDHEAFKRLLLAINKHCKISKKVRPEEKKQKQSLKKKIAVLCIILIGLLFIAYFNKDLLLNYYRTVSSALSTYSMSSAPSAIKLNYDEAITLLDKVVSNEIEMTQQEKIDLYAHLYRLSKVDAWDINPPTYTPSALCGNGVYQHVVSNEDSLKSIIDSCDYELKNSEYLLTDTTNALKVGDIVTTWVDDNKVITRINILKKSGELLSIDPAKDN